MQRSSAYPWTNTQGQSSNSSNGFPGLESPRAAGGKEDYRSRQRDEIDALRSIFMEDFEDITNDAGAWSKSADLSFKLKLAAYSDPDTSVILSVTLTATYPLTVPLLRVDETEYLRESYRKKVFEILENKPKALLGSEMIYDIASHIQDTLEDAVQAKEQDEKLPSLEEERIMREEAAAKEEEERQNELERQKEEAGLEADRMLEQMVADEMRRQKERLRDNQRKIKIDDEEPDLLEEESGDKIDRLIFDQAISIEDEDGSQVLFRTTSGMTPLRQGPVTSVFTVRPSVRKGRPLGTALILKQVEIGKRDKKIVDLKKEVLDLEKELEALKKLRESKHANILNVLDFKVDRRLANDGPSSETWKISVLTEYANKGSLDDLLSMVGALATSNIRAWSIQLLEALEFYHCNGIVHRAVHAGNVLLVRPRTGATVVKLADGGYQRHLHDLKDKSVGAAGFDTARSAYWIAPELAQGQFNRHTRKTDLWDLGVVFLEMSLGPDLMGKHSSPDMVLDSVGLSSSADDFVRKLFKADPKRRPNAFDLLASEFVRSDAPILEEAPSNNHSRLSSSASFTPLRPTRSRQDSTVGQTATSRYANDFHELERVGKGGFGEVFKSRNKLDGQIYAIKKITQSSRGSLSQVLSEIMLLSRLNHPYVVRYFNTWLEEQLAWPSDTEEDSTDFTESSTSPGTGPAIEFGHSTGGLDIISSTGGPDIQFGYDTDEESEESDDDGSESVHASQLSNAAAVNSSDQVKALELKRTRSSTYGQRYQRTTLYIQMEFCDKRTLRDLLKKDTLKNDNDKIWRLLQQILEGLNHIHGHKIIHRDLKPDNIFIDASDNPRIGDFGLATSGQYYLADKSLSSAGDIDSDLTRSIGTALYVAPELRSNVNGHYTEKVDMYSLGIIFFEMCYPLSTAMERDRVIRELREKVHSLPPEFNQPEKITQGSIIKSLLSHRHSERPTAAELLQSGKLPVQIGDETIRQALRGLSDSESPYHEQIISALFSQPPQEAKDYAWDLGSTANQGSQELLLQSLIKEQLTAIFRHHGAVETSRPLLLPRSSYQTANVVQLLDSSGTLVQLPYDLTLPYARLVAKQAPSAQKTFAFGNIYRDMYTGGQPRSHGEVDFDIVTYDSLDLGLKEAEVVKVIDEVVNSFPSLSSHQMCFHINHSDLLDLVMDFCRITPMQRPAVKEIVSKLNIGQYTWPKIRTELRSPSLGVSSTSLDDLSRFDFRDTPEKAFERLNLIFDGTDHHAKCSSIFAHINVVITYCSRFNVRSKIYLSPLSSFNDKYYRGGILFQCLYDTKRRDVFAAGGRYDSLIQHHRPKLHGHQEACHAVGFNLIWEKLYTSMIKLQKSSSKSFLKKPSEELQGHWAMRRCDILVASFDSKVLRTAGIDLVRDLWANSLAAELAVDSRSPEELVAIYKEDKHSWIVIVKQDLGAGGERLLRVKSMITREDTEIRSSELVGWLRSELRAKGHREGTNERAKIHRLSSQGDNGVPLIGGSGVVGANGSGAENVDQEVRVLFSTIKHKRQNRRHIVESSQSRVAELIRNNLADAPIAAVELRDDILDQIRDATSLADPESWRKLIQSVPGSDRAYLGQVREMLAEIAKRGNKGVGSRYAFVYSVRTGGCIFYDLGRTT